MSRTLVLGLDGVPRTLALALAAEGVMPNLACLLSGATMADLTVPVPEISSTSWASFLTGVNPGAHRIFGFVDLAPNSYQAILPNVRHLGAPPLWEWSGRHGLRSICLNIPGTYPAMAVPTGMVSGFVATDFDRAVQPPRWRPLLRELGYQLDVNADGAAEHPDAFLNAVEMALRRRTDAFVRLLSTEPFDLAVAVLTETDRLQHFFWRDVCDENSPRYERIRGFYRLVDEAVGRLIATVGDDGEVFLVSDHGFTHVTHQFYLNLWLRERRWLADLATSPVLGRVDEHTRAFALDPGRIYLNRAGRFPAGTVREEEADRVAAGLSEELLALRYDGRRVAADVDGPPVVAAVLRGADEYRGRYAAHGPDLIVMPAPHFQVRGGWTGPSVVDTSALTGTHTRDNALFLRRGCILAEDRLDMTDLLPTVLESVGIATGSACDGRVAARSSGRVVSGRPQP